MQLSRYWKGAAIAAVAAGGVMAASSAFADIYVSGPGYYAPNAYGAPVVGSPEANGPGIAYGYGYGPPMTYGYVGVPVAGPYYAYDYTRGHGRRGMYGYISESDGSLTGRIDQY